MKILWFPRYQPDIEKLTPNWREMYKALTSMGHTVQLAVSGRPAPGIVDFPYNYVPILRKGHLRLVSFWISGFINFIIRYFMLVPDVVILDIFSVWFGIVPFLFPGKIRSTIVLDNRTPFYNASGKQTKRDIFFRLYTRLAYIYWKCLGGGVTTITQYYKESLSREFNMPLSRIGVWGSGVDIDKFNLQISPESNDRFPWAGKFTIIQHGEISYNRGILESIKAMSLINNNKIALVLIGNSINNPEIDATIDELIHDLDLYESVYRISTIPYEAVPRYISSSNCAIMAYPNIEYWNNNNPLKLVEYLSMGKVVICTDMWTFRDVCGESRCGVYIKDNDPKTIADTINWCYKNRDYLNEWGGDGVDIVKTRFTWKRQAEMLLDFICGEKRKHERITD